MSRYQEIIRTPAPRWPLYAYDLSHEKKLSFKLGQLIPIYWEDISPGDKFKVRSEVFIRFAPMLAPILHRVNATVHYFWVPYRLLMMRKDDTYADWEGFITGDPESVYTNETCPYITISNANKNLFEKGDLPDYFGFPPIDSGTTVTQDVDFNCMPFMAYQLIYDHYYRDQNLITARCEEGGQITLQGGDRTAEDDYILGMRQRCWEKDYFTASLPTAYAGASSDVELDLDVWGTGGHISWREYSGQALMDAGDIKADGATNYLRTAAGDEITLGSAFGQGIIATLEMYELRRSMALVRALEAEQRGGKRYQEQLLGVFGVIGEGYKNLYPRYLGGGKQVIHIQDFSSMANVYDPTCGANDGVGMVPVLLDPQANYAGQGISYGKANGFVESFSEHGIVIGILSVLPRTAYQDGIERYWRKIDDRFDFFNPFLQNIGDQEVYQGEIFYDPTGSDYDDIWGYAPRWSEYKQRLSSVHADFRDDFNYWHMGRQFSAAPSLNAAFVTADYTAEDCLNRIFAVTTAAVDKCYAQVFNDVRALRQMKLHDIPK